MILFQGALLMDFLTIDVFPFFKHSSLQPHLWVPATTLSSHRAPCTLFLPLPPQFSSISAFTRATHPVGTGTFHSCSAFSGFVLSFAVSHFFWGCPAFLWELQNTAPFHPSSLATLRPRSLGSYFIPRFYSCSLLPGEWKSAKSTSPPALAFESLLPWTAYRSSNAVS